jgi:hypothetical protein
MHLEHGKSDPLSDSKRFYKYILRDAITVAMENTGAARKILISAHFLRKPGCRLLGIGVENRSFGNFLETELRSWFLIVWLIS